MVNKLFENSILLSLGQYKKLHYVVPSFVYQGCWLVTDQRDH